MIKKKQSNKDIDLALVRRAKAGDCRAFDLLVVKYQSRLISLAYKFSKDLHLAEDIVQDSLIKSIKSLHYFSEEVIYKSIDVFLFVPAITGILRLKASSLADVLSPNIFRVFSLGPINLIFALLTEEAKRAFSLKNP